MRALWEVHWERATKYNNSFGMKKLQKKFLVNYAQICLSFFEQYTRVFKMHYVDKNLEYANYEVHKIEW